MSIFIVPDFVQPGNESARDDRGNLVVNITANYGHVTMAYVAAAQCGKFLGAGVKPTLKEAMHQAVDELLDEIERGAKL